MTRTALISGAGVAGTVLAYWLARDGVATTVVDRAPDIRRTGGHALDLSGASTEVIERMGLLPAVTEARVRRDALEFHRRGRRPVRMPRLSETIADRHVEIQRDALVTIMHDAAAAHAEFRFGDTVTALTESERGVRVEFEHASARTYDLVIGADGLHSRIRRLAFGPEERYRRDLGAFLSVYSYPNAARLDREVVGVADVDRSAFTYAVDDGQRARALLLFRAEHPGADLRDRVQQQRFVRHAFTGIEEDLPIPLREMDRADDFYFDSISQIRMDTWSTGRVTLVGDAAYSPGPAVGGGTSMAVLGAYVLAHELALAGGDHRQAFASTERVMRWPVEQSRKVGPSALAQLVPDSRLAAWATPHVLRLLTRLPRAAAHALFSLQGSDKHVLDDFSSEPVPGSGAARNAIGARQEES